MKKAEDQLKKFANVGASLLQLPKVQAAIKQSLSTEDVKIAQVAPLPPPRPPLPCLAECLRRVGKLRGP